MKKKKEEPIGIDVVWKPPRGIIEDKDIGLSFQFDLSTQSGPTAEAQFWSLCGLSLD